MTRSVRAAILSFTDIDAEQHRAFNEWHRYDHMPEQAVLDGIVAGERFVATPDLMARRQVVDESLAAAMYFGFYLISEPVEETFQRLGELPTTLRGQAGRWPLAPRPAAVTAPPTSATIVRRGPSGGYRLVEMSSAPNVVSSPSVMPFRPHQGVFVTVHDPEPGAGTRDLAVDLEQHQTKRVQKVMAVPGVAGCWTFHAAAGIPGNTPAPTGRAVRVYWLHADPAKFLDGLEAQTLDECSGRPRAYSSVLSGCYRSIQPDSSFDWFVGH